MKKPVAPKKPSKRDPIPTPIIEVTKLLVKDQANNYKLIDEITDPLVFTDPETGEINNELFAFWSALDSVGYDQDNEYLKYSDYKKIYELVPSDDFQVRPQYNEDRYYDFTHITYKIGDSHYKKKLAKYNNRFVEYENQLKEYRKALVEYKKYKAQEKIQKLQHKIQKLQHENS